MTPEEKTELADLLEENLFRRKPFGFEQAKHTDINGVEHDIFVVKLKLRPPHMMAKMEQR